MEELVEFSENLLRILEDRIEKGIKDVTIDKMIKQMVRIKYWSIF
jgi:hypothetical protein